MSKVTPSLSSKFSHPDLGDVEQLVVMFNALREPRLVVQYFWCTLFSAKHGTPDHNDLQLTASGQELSELSSSGSALASRAPRTTCCRSRWVIVCTRQDDGAIQWVPSNTDVVTAHSLGTSTPTYLLGTVAKTIIPQDLRGIWTSVRYTAVPLRILLNRLLFV